MLTINQLKQKYEGAIFDMDGLLVNSEQLYWDANVQASKEMGLGMPEDSYLRLIGASVQAMNQFYQTYFQDQAQVKAFIKRTDDLVWEWSQTGKLKLQPGVHELLRNLRASGLKLAVASSNYQPVVQQFLTVTGIIEYFDFYLSDLDVQSNHLHSKPAPDIYQLASQKIGLALEKIVVFEDSSTGVLAASSAGLDCIMVPDLLKATSEDQSRAKLVLDNLTQLLP